jgi:fusion protein PurCD
MNKNIFVINYYQEKNNFFFNDNITVYGNREIYNNKEFKFCYDAYLENYKQNISAIIFNSNINVLKDTNVLDSINQYFSNEVIPIVLPYLKITLLDKSVKKYEANILNNMFIHDFKSFFLNGKIKKVELMCYMFNNNTNFVINNYTNNFSDFDNFYKLFPENKLLFSDIELNNISKNCGYHLLSNREYYMGSGCANGNNKHDFYTLHKGKVRDVYRVGINRLCIEVTDRISAFDKVCGEIYGKGKILNNISCHQFELLKDVIPTHYIYGEDKYMIVKECKPIKLEIIVRRFLTGSLWKLYNEKGFDYVNKLYGINLPDGLRKNQRLNELIVTPTTKDDNDSPINHNNFTNPCHELYIMPVEEWRIIKNYALMIFGIGTEFFNENGFLLVDTKYEFGRDIETGNILLIDEVHTPDSSRFWNMNTYEIRFNSGKEPQCYDKQFFRNWLIQENIKSKLCDPEFKVIIPDNIKEQFIEHYYFILNRLNIVTTTNLNNPNSYNNINQLLNKFYDYYDNNHVYVCAGSRSDGVWVRNICEEINKLGFNCTAIYGSAHKNTQMVIDDLNSIYSKNKNRRLVFVTVAGRSNALSGVVSCNVSSPVIACPPFKDKTDMMVNINSTLVMPSNVPVMTILEPRNVAISVQRILT